MKLLISRTLLACAFLAPTVFADTFVERNGILIMEAESSAATGDWDLESSIGGYSGNGYLRWNGPDYFGTPGNGTITYRFRIERAGNYELLWRSRITRGNNRTEHNDSWARFPTGQNINGEHGLDGWTKVFMSTLNEWAWQSATVDNVGRRVRQYFSAGEHTMQISGRSNGHAIDRIALYNYPDISINTGSFNSLSSAGTSGSSTPSTPVTQDPVVEPTPAPEPAPEPIVEPAPEPVATVDAPVLAVAGNDLMWSEIDAIAINIHRGDGTWVESLAGNATQWSAPAAGEYYAVATGEGTWETWGRSATVTATAPAAEAPADATQGDSPAQGGSASGQLVAEVYSGTALELFWSSADSAALTFEVRRNDQLLTVTDGRSFFDSELNAGTQYSYTVTGVDVAGSAVFEQSVSATTSGGTSTTVAVDNGGLNLTAEVYSQSALELFWNIDESTLSASVQFEVYLDSNLLDTVDARSLFLENLTAGTQYNLVVIALDSSGSAVLTESVVATTFGPDNQ